ncbi:MAG: YHYH protein [Planctomycetales bacterium]|nr:YHYH protein [bacterium]UNM08564.1 MAG: YHYH protein [Planctomycetales bacterium]
MNRSILVLLAVLLVSLAAAVQIGCSGGSAAALPLDNQLDPLQGQQVIGDSQQQQAAGDQSSADVLQEDSTGGDSVGDLLDDGAVQQDSGSADGGQVIADSGDSGSGNELTIDDWFEQEYGYNPDDIVYPDPLDDSGSGDEVVDALEISGRNGTVITQDATYRYISSNGLPDHEIGNNGNVMTEQSYSFRMPLDPVANSSATPYYLPDPFGIAINGVPFDPFANEFWNRDMNSGWQLEPMPDGLGLDFSHGHVQPGGAYHYHGLPWGTLTGLDGSAMGLVGFAADGFPVYALYGYEDAWDSGSAVVELESSYRLRSGMRNGGPGGIYDGTYIEDYEYVEGLGDLDECNGRFGVTPEFPEGTYYYVITQDYPYIPRKFRGTPDASFKKQRGASRVASSWHVH